MTAFDWMSGPIAATTRWWVSGCWCPLTAPSGHGAGRSRSRCLSSGLAMNRAAICAPGNLRAGGQRNPPYESTDVFNNDFAALPPDTPPAGTEDPLLRYQSHTCTCRVVCFSAGHVRRRPHWPRLISGARRPSGLSKSWHGPGVSPGADL